MLSTLPPSKSGESAVKVQQAEPRSEEQITDTRLDELVLLAFKQAMSYRVFRLMQMGQISEREGAKLPPRFWTGEE